MSDKTTEKVNRDADSWNQKNGFVMAIGIRAERISRCAPINKMPRAARPSE